MMMRVRERGDELLIELSGLAGRQQRVLQALTECQRVCADTEGGSPSAADVSVRAGSDAMRIRMRSGHGHRFEASRIYQCLRRVLIEQRAIAPAG
jgi:hypothetical protein